MKTKLKTTLALLAAFCGLQLFAATPVAVWTDFTKLTSGSYTLTVDDSCVIGKDGSVTIGATGGLKISVADGSTIRTAGAVTIVADVENVLSTGDKRTIFSIKDSGNQYVNLTKNADDTIYSKANDSTGYGNIGGCSTIGKAQLAYAYATASGTDAWLEGSRKANSGSLKWSNNSITDLYIGSYDGTTQVMQGLKIKKLTIYASKLTTVGDICLNGPTYLYKFNGNMDALGSSSLTFGGEATGNYGVGPDAQALKITDGATHPHGSNWSYGDGNWTVSTFVKPIANASSKIIIWTTGVKTGWFGLLSDSANNKVILAAGNGSGISTTICEVSVPNIADFYHLYTVRFVGNNTYELIVDGNTAAKASKAYSTAIPTSNFQIGAVNQGLPTGLARTTGTLIDDFRQYRRSISDDEVVALARSLQTPETISINIGGGRGTGDLAANSDHLVQTSDCTGLMAAPGAAWNNLAKQWQSGAGTKKFTMEAGTVKATDGTKLITPATVAVNIQANNTYDGGATRVNSFHKGYLDDGSYDGHRSYIKVTGIPYARYNVIIYTATDDSNSNYAPVKVNGVQYRWDTSTVQGTTAWGDRNATATVFGKNALIVQSAYGSTLEVEGTSVSGGRGGIAAIQIVDMGAAQAKVVSVNFGSNQQSVDFGTDPGGIRADKYWWNVSGGSGTDVQIDTAKVTFDAAGTYAGDATQQHLKGYLDENKGGTAYPIAITVKNLKDAIYDVYIYCESDNAKGWSKKTVNGVDYYAGSDGEAIKGTSNWGSNGTTSVMGTNVMVVRNVTLNDDGNIVIGSARNGDYRGCVAAIQLELKRTSVDYTGTISAETATWSSKAGITSSDAWVNSPDSTITLANNDQAESTLTFDKNVTAAKFTLTSVAEKDTTVSKTDAATISIAAYDFSGANGKATVGFGTGAATVTAGSDTVFSAVGTGALSIGSGKKATLPAVWSNISLASGGTATYVGTGYATIPWLENTTAINGTVEFAGTCSTANGLSFGNANKTINLIGGCDVTLGGRLAIGNEDNTTQHVLQSGGTVHLNGTGDASGGSGNANTPLLISHWKGSNRSYKITGGELYAENGVIRLGWDGGATLQVGGGTGSAVLKAKGIRGGTDRTGKGTLALDIKTNGKLKLGDSGVSIQDGNNADMKLSGGAIVAYGNATIATSKAITLSAASTLAAESAKTLTVSSVISGEGGLTIGGASDTGTVVLSGANTYSGGTTVSAGTLVVTTPNGNYTVDGGTLTPVNPSENSEITVNQNGTFSYAQDISAGDTFAKSKFVANAGTVALTVTMSKAQVQAEPKTAIALLGSGITETTGFTVTVLNADTGNPVENVLTIEDNVLYVTPQGAQQTLTYTPTESGNFTWQVGSQIGAKKYRDYDNIMFATTVYTNTVNVPSKIAATRLTVGGTYNFTGSMIIASLLDTAEGAYATFANDVIADSAIITNGTVMANSIVASEVAVTNATFGAKVLGPSMKYVRLTITETQSSGEKPAVAEFRLYRGSATTGYTIVDWPKGTKVTDSMGYVAIKETSNYPGEVYESQGRGGQGGNEKQPGDLIDGYYGTDDSTPIYGGGTYHTPKYNKWWPNDQAGSGPWVVTIEFPDPVAMFSGCNFCLSDHAPRNPKSWTIEVSSDGENWTEVNNTSGATWDTQWAWKGGNENVPAFLNTGTTPTDVKVGTDSTIVADGNWTAALEVGGDVTFKGVAGANLTLDAASTSKFDTVSAKLTFDLREYDVSQAGKQYVIAGPTAGWPETSAITVIPSTFKLFKDDAGYYVEVVSGTYWIGDQAEGVGTWDLNNTQAWGKDAATADKAVWLNGDEAFFTRNGTVTISGDGVDPKAINITSNNAIAVTLNNAEKITGKAFKIGSTNVTVTLNVGDAMTLGTVTAVADSIPKFVKTGAGTLTVNSGNQFAGGAVVVSNGTLLVGSTSAFTGLGTLTAEDTGVIDVNGKALTRAFTLGAGGSLVNNGDSIGNNKAQMNTLTLTGNAFVGGTGNFGLITNDYNASSLNLGAYTLTKTGANSFWLCNTTISGTGTIQIDAGTLAVSDNSGNAKTTTFADGTFSVGASGALQVDSNKTLTLGKLSMTTGATITNNGTINGLKELTDADLTAVGGTLGFHADGVTVKGTVKISDGKFGSANVTVADEAKINLTLDASAYEATITTGTLTFPTGKGVADCVTINGSPAMTWKIKENGKIYDTSRLAYYAANVTATPATWSTKTGLTKETGADDWANGVKSTITLASMTAGAELTFDVATTAAVLKVTGAQNLTLKKGQDIDVQIASIDLTEATGKITIDFNPGAATIKTGVDTVLNAVGTGAITIGTDHVLTVKGSGLTASKVTNNGTIAFNGGNAETPINITGDGNFGVTTLGENTYVKNTVNGNHKHLVTGQGASSHYALTGKGFADGSAFTNLTLVACGSESLWIERGIGENVRLEVLDGQSATIGNDSLTYNAPFIALNGSGEVKSKHDSTLTINCTEAATYSGTSSIAITIGGTAVQTLSGNYTGALTVLENAKAALKVGATYAINVNNAGTLRLIDNETTKTTLTAATFNNTGTLDLSDTGINTLAIGTLTSFGTVTWPAEVAGTVKITSGGATRDFTEIKTKLSGFSGAVELDITETLAENAAGQVALTGAPAGAKIVLTRIDGSVIEGTASAEGAFTQKVDVLAYGAACLFDYTFTNTVVVAAGSRNKDYALQFDKGISPIYSETEDSMLLYCSPWIQMNNLMYSLDTFSVAMYGKVSATNNTFFISFGSGTQNHMLFLASNADGTKVDVVYYDGTNHQLSQIEVPNMTTASHLYVFSKTSARDLYIYLDGALWQHVVSPVDLVMGSSTHSGVQFGSGFGTRPSPYDRVPSTDTTADVGTLRVYDYVVSEKQLAALKTDFPYSSPDTYARTVDTATTNWVSAAAWTKKAETFDAPDAKGAVKVTADADTTVSVNLGTETAVNYEKVTFDGKESISLVLAQDNTIPVKAMQFEFETDVTVTPESIDLGSAQTTTIGANGKLTIDLRGIDCGAYTTNFVKEITGTCTDSGLVAADKLAIIKPTEMYGRDMTIIYKSNNKYAVEVALKSDVTAMYWKPTETVLTNTTHLTDSTGEKDYVWWQTMPITVNANSSLTSITGDCQNTTFLVNSGISLNVGTLRTVKIGGAGNVTVKLTADEYVPGAVITAFVQAAESTAAVTTVLDPSGNDVTSKAVIEGNKITMKKEAKIGTQYYFVLADAIEAAEANATVTLCTNVTGFAYTLNKNITFDGDIWEIAGSGFTVGDDKTLTISGGYIGMSRGSGTIVLTGGKFTDDGTNTWAACKSADYHFADLASLDKLYESYKHQIIAGSETRSGEAVYPAAVVDGGTTNYVGDLAFTKQELKDKGIIESTETSDADVAKALSTPGKNERPTWENVVLGLSNTDPLAAPVPTPVQSSDPTKLKLRLDNLDVSTTSGAKVTYKVTTTTGGVETTKTAEGVEAEFDLPQSGVSYYKFEVTVTPAK